MKFKVNFSESSVPIVATAIGIASQNQFWYTIASADRSFDYLNQNYKPISVPLTDNIAYTSDFNTFYLTVQIIGTAAIFLEKSVRKV
jgi:hypothetical protein